jgi:hypothetical protein
MTGGTTPADGTAPPLKGGDGALDSCRAMRTQELRVRIQCADYVVDPVLVAEAMFRHALSHRRWWNPIAVCALPAASMIASGWPATTDPIQVKGAASSAAARSSGSTQTQSS